jgi:acyl-CoA synthetase (AMP-forming)/AMP-acid ligase II
VSSFQRLRERAPAANLFTFVDDRGEDHETLTVSQLATAADGIARALRSWGLVTGDRAVLVHPPSLDFVKAFLGCLAAGVTPVPVCPPNPFRLKHDMAAFRGIVASAGARAVLTNSEYDRVRELGEAGPDEIGWPDIPWYQTDQCPPGQSAPTDWHIPATSDQPAFLQYTSGSTGSPKGVVITHGNLWHEMRANAVDLGLGPDTTGVFWVPHFHDLGLICAILNTVVGNSLNTHLMSPLTFLKRPAIWADVMSRVRATHTAAPNFAYELLVRKTTPEIRRQWDLSSMRVMASAGEPVRSATARAFIDAFADSKFPPEAFCSAYGLAECSVTVAVGGRTELRLDRRAFEAGRVVPLTKHSPRPAVTVFSAGPVTKPETSVRIVDPDTGRPCPPGRIGEIWIDSPTKAAGYWGLWEETEKVFRAKVAGEDSGREYLRTGDLGFFSGDELFVTGRHKDLIIIHGHNLYPHDIEDSVRGAHPLIRPGGIAAFAVPAGDTDSAGERLVVLAEVSEASLDATDQEKILRAIRRRVYEDHQIACHTVVLGTAGTVRKTTSGKIRRRACHEAFLNGEIHAADATIRVFVRPGSAPRPRESAR